MDSKTDFAKVFHHLGGQPQPLSYAGAPGWHFYAWPMPDHGYLAFGAGVSERLALLRCLGEAAEVLSVTRRASDKAFRAERLRDCSQVEISVDRVVSTGSPDASDPGNEGAAAGASLSQAWRSAAWECVERDAIFRWWSGDLAAAKVDDGWIEAHGLARIAETARGGAEADRHIRLICLEGRGDSPVFIAVSERLDGSSPVLGYGAGSDPAKAAAKAMSEALQMEVSLAMAWQAAQQGAGGHHPILQRAAALEGDYAARIRAVGPPYLPACVFKEDRKTLAGIVGRDAIIVDLSRADIGVPVARIVAPGLASARLLKFGGAPSPL